MHALLLSLPLCSPLCCVARPHPQAQYDSLKRQADIMDRQLGKVAAEKASEKKDEEATT